MQPRTTLTIAVVALLLAVPAATAQFAGADATTAGADRVTNDPPRAEAGLDQTGVVGVPVYLDGGGSLDRDGEIIAHEWRITAPSGVRHTRTGVRAEFTPTETGEYTVRLTVEDDDGAERSDTAYVTVREPTTAAPTATATPTPEAPPDDPTTPQQTETATPTATATPTPLPSLLPGGDDGRTVPTGPLLPTDPSPGFGNTSTAGDTRSYYGHADWRGVDTEFETTAAFETLTCVDCDATHDPATVTHRCPDCGGILDPMYDLSTVDLSAATLRERRFDSMWRYEELLPFPRSAAVSLGEGTTPLVDCPGLAAEMGVGEVYIKDEGRNPTGTFKDRGQAAAVTAAALHGADEIALNTAGNAGQAAAAYAARADVDAHVFLPERAGFTQKAMTELHDGDLRVAEGEITDAGSAYWDAVDAEGEEWYSTKTFVTPYRHDGKKTMGHEILEQLEFESPDAVVYPTGGGVGLLGVHKGAGEFRELGLVDDRPSLYAAQAEGCAPVVDAWHAGADEHDPVPSVEVDTACNGIAVPDPGASPLLLDAMAESDGGAVATADRAILDAAVTVARTEGIEVGATCAAAVSGAFALAERGEFGPEDTVVLLNTGAGNKDVDTLRAHVGEREVA
jgi:threonine synthase